MLLDWSSVGICGGVPNHRRCRWGSHRRRGGGASASPENIAPSEPHLGLAARSSTLESEHGCSTPGVVLGGRSNPPILDAGADKWDSRGWAFGCSPLGGFHVSPFADPGR
jgi:hypothetical protein